VAQDFGQASALLLLLSLVLKLSLALIRFLVLALMFRVAHPCDSCKGGDFDSVFVLDLGIFDISNFALEIRLFPLSFASIAHQAQYFAISIRAFPQDRRPALLPMSYI